MFCSEHLTGKHDFFTSHFYYNLYLQWIISIISYILSLWNLFETKIVSNGALDPFNNLLYSSPENKFSITGELTAPWVKSLFILYSKIFDSYYLLKSIWKYFCHNGAAHICKWYAKMMHLHAAPKAKIIYIVMIDASFMVSTYFSYFLRCIFSRKCHCSLPKL